MQRALKVSKIDKFAHLGTVELVPDPDAHDMYQLRWSTNVFSCDDDASCASIGLFAGTELGPHKKVEVALPSHLIVPLGARQGPPTGEFTAILMCVKMVTQFNESRDAMIQWNHAWRWTCVMLTRAYPKLRDATGAFKLFSKRYLSPYPEIKVITQ
jgi:hypothetical protein